MWTVLLMNLLVLVELAASQVYVGTGTSGSVVVKDGNDVLALGGLFPVHRNEDNRCGSILDLGVQRLEAMVLATQNINDDPSFLPGVTLAFEIRDTCTQANYALEQSLDYVSARSLTIGSENSTILGVSGVVGAASSSVSIAVANLLRLFNIPQISPASTAAILSDKTRFDYFFRTIPPDSLQARTMAEIIKYFNWTYIIEIHSDDAYGSDGASALIEELDRVNASQICIATSVELPLVATAEDFERAVEIINQEWVSNATVVVLFGQLATAIGLLEAVERRREVDMEFASRNLTWIGSDAWGDQIPAELHPLTQGMLSVLPRSKRSNNFDNYFQSLHPLNYTANPWFGEYWESIFNCSLQSRPGSELCDLSTQVLTPESGYRQNSKVTFTFDAVYAFAHVMHKLQQDFCPGGRGLCPEIVDTRSGGLAIQGELLLQYLHNVSFSPGLSAEVITFDDNGDQEGGFLVKNLQQISEGRFAFEVIGRWDEVPHDRDSSLEIFSEIQWHLGYDETPESICSHPCGGGEYPEPVSDQAECCWICKPCIGIRVVSKGLECRECELGYLPNAAKTECIQIPPTFLTWSSVWSILILIVTSIGALVTAFVVAIFIVYHKHQLIKASSRELSAVLLTGIMLCYLLPFFFIAMPSPVICAIRRFGVGFCFSLCYSALLVKTNRIHRIFNRPSGSIQTPPLISPQSQLFFTALLVGVQVVIAVVWLVIERPNIAYVFSDFTTELKCDESSVVGISVSLGYNLILLVISTYFAFRTRKIPQNFNEAKFINLTLYTLIIIWLAFLTTYFATARLGTVYQTSSLVLAIALSATTTLCCLFMPKIYFLYSQVRKESSPSGSQGSNHRDRHNSVCSTNGILLGAVSGERKKSLLFQPSGIRCINWP